MATTTEPEITAAPEPAPKPMTLRRRIMSRDQHPVEAAGHAVGDQHFVRRCGRIHWVSVRALVAARLGVRPADRDPSVAITAIAGEVLGPGGLPDHLYPGSDDHRGHPGVHARFRPTERRDDRPGAVAVDGRLLQQFTSRTAEQAQTGNNLDIDALLPTSNAQKYLQAHYTAPFNDWDKAIRFDDARDGSAWSAANARFNDFFREIVLRFRVRGRVAARQPRQCGLHRL